MNYITHYNSPLGSITLASDGDALIGLWFDGQKHFGSTLGGKYEEKPLPVFDRTAAWLDIYFGGGIPDFTPKIALNDTNFRREVWDILLTIPYGHTMTYGGIAATIAQKRGVPSISAQAVGGAVGRNPISIIVPCHRVIGADGSFTGYAGGIERKEELLRIESRCRVDKLRQ